MNSQQELKPFLQERNNYKWKALATVAMGTMMATIDASITNIAFPVLTETFHSELTTVMWVTIAYILVSTCSMLVLGKISDHVGRKKIYALGMAIFTLGLLVCSLAQSIGQLIFFRTLQALGAAMTIGCGTAIVTEAFPAKEIGRGLGLLGVAVSLGFIIGPVLGGFLLHLVDWRAIFFVRVPVGLITLLMACTLLKERGRAAGSIDLDLPGTFLSSAGLFCFVFGVTQIRRLGLGSPFVYLLLGIGLVALVVFAFVERRTRNPIVDLALFKNRVFSGAAASLFLLFAAAPAVVLIMPFYLMQGIGLNPSEAGILLAVHSMSALVFGPVSGWLADRFGPYWFAATGAAALTAAFGLMRTFGLQTPATMIIPVLVLSGIGVGAFQAPNNSMIMGGVPRDRLGTASALIATLRQVGISVGMTLAGTLFTARRAMYEADFVVQGIGPADLRSLTIPPAFHDVLIISVTLGALVTLFSLLCGGRRTGHPPQRRQGREKRA